ncbi:MAG: hypothetical protein KGI54_05900 [Pseudomonadota bacterium]|nr:hypothetical protein [Pseudomonadota bacterium]
MKTHKTNQQVIDHLMNYSVNGALIQPFILVALEYYSRHILQSPVPDMDNGFVSMETWKRCAQETLDTVNQHLRKTSEPAKQPEKVETAIDSSFKEPESAQAVQNKNRPFNLSTVVEIEKIASILVQDAIGDYDTPDNVVEWKWIRQNASFSHKQNGEHGVYEFILNLSRLGVGGIPIASVPEKLRPYIDDAIKRGVAYMIFHQGT